MAIHQIVLNQDALLGWFTKNISPILTINDGDSVRFQTLDGGWGSDIDGKRTKKFLRYENAGHALIGPIKINGAKQGMVLEVEINEIIPGSYGFTSAGQWPNWQNIKTNLTGYDEITLDWRLDKKNMVGQCEVNGRIFTVALKPFLGIMGMPPDEEGIHSTSPPRNCGGNIDCKELVKGSVLYLPISVDGAFFAAGDGHAAQGDGEVSCQAIECPMELIDLTFHLRNDLQIKTPRANTPSGWITFGFHEDLNEATVIALNEMLNLLGELYGLNRVEAMALGSSVIDLRITQIVNGVKGVHACLPHGALR
ncbi:acetamidase/formamidase family protein [Cohnella soli]|uniref:Acetamidase/formamidase family protein n=1 Tax=Cohnella soli TaxID=425005 RepID=A0ABW0HX31_9BACL